MTPKTLTEAIRYFADRDNCKTFMVARRWPKGVTCPQCGSDAVYWDSSRYGWECKTRHERRKFTLKTGTIFEDSALGLDKWLPAVWMIANMKNGVSSHELARSLGVTQKTAWFMLQRIRLAMQGETGGKLEGSVEVDETYIGGKARHTIKRARRVDRKGRVTGKARKAVVMGLLDRNTRKVRTFHVESIKKHVLAPVVRENLEAGSELYTDALASYRELGQEYVHGVVDHAETYVDGNIHTNGIENYWSLLKRGLKGTYVSVEPFHLFRYLDEQAFRFNERKGTDADRFGLAVDGIVSRRLTYKGLTGKESLRLSLN